ncbi:MAG: SUMF1/EgtB/PvdO family nonheme iron enzyme [Alphaproteobacteria bacterium]|nr:SUMF1/EgtB/PvdO family nonheme iron enzyme [Alphaproteobacteria bacterium]
MEGVFAWAARWGIDPEAVAELAHLLGESPSDSVPQAPAPRRLALLGRGGTAEVWSAWDDDLQRKVALKVLRPELQHVAEARDRFSREARTTAALTHPGIVPVHRIGTLDDGRPYFTMDVVKGTTLDRFAAEQGPAGMRRVLDRFERACQAVAYAHDQGVLHRDLKPANIMVGPFGTVFVLDWGLVRWAEGTPTAPGLTALGDVPGTPGYLAPEQLAGRPLGPTTDVYALGLVLWELLHGRPAFDPGRRGSAADRVPPCTAGPADLRAVVARATLPDPTARHADARELASAIRSWLDGEERRARADADVREAAGLARESAALHAREQALRAEAAALLDGVPPWAPVERRAPGWAVEDEARAVAERAALVDLRRLQALHGALTHDADHAEALAALSTHWRERHRAAEHLRDGPAAREALAQLAFYDRGEATAYIEGRGSLRITARPGAEATLYRFDEVDRVQVPVDPRPLGATPVTVEGLEMGSWLVAFAGTSTVLPVWLPRCGRVEASVELPHAGVDACFVPGGPFWSGSPDAAFQRRPWGEVDVPSFFMGRHPVTHADYIAFLDDLVHTGREDDAVRFAPHERAAPDQPGRMCYARRSDGTFELAPDADGDLWDPRWPVFLVDHTSATAYAAWLAARTGLPWRLPTELEWEKAARGVDGRAYPWGDRFDATFACVRSSHAGRPLPASVDAFPTDCSVYGVRGMAGNMRDWCADAFRVPGREPAPGDTQKVLKGGCWYFPETGAHLAARYALDAHNRGDTISFRVARSVVPGDLA